MLLHFDSIIESTIEFVKDTIEAIAEDDTFLENSKSSPKSKYRDFMSELFITRGINHLKSTDPDFRNLSDVSQVVAVTKMLRENKEFRHLIESTMSDIDVPRRFDAIMDALRKK